MGADTIKCWDATVFHPLYAARDPIKPDDELGTTVVFDWRYVERCYLERKERLKDFRSKWGSPWRSGIGIWTDFTSTPYEKYDLVVKMLSLREKYKKENWERLRVFRHKGDTRSWLLNDWKLWSYKNYETQFPPFAGLYKTAEFERQYLEALCELANSLPDWERSTIYSVVSSLKKMEGISRTLVGRICKGQC